MNLFTRMKMIHFQCYTQTGYLIYHVYSQVSKMSLLLEKVCYFENSWTTLFLSKTSMNVSLFMFSVHRLPELRDSWLFSR